MSIRYIADLHIYDSYSMEWRQQYKTLDNFSYMLEESWNMVVTDDDTVIVAGDVGYPCDKTTELLLRLKGHKVLVMGNHDLPVIEYLRTCGVFTGVYARLDSNGVIVCHAPVKNESGGYLIHGHHHRYDLPGMYKELLLYANDTYRLNCSADIVGNTPRTLQELIVIKESMIDSFRSKGLLKED